MRFIPNRAAAPYGPPTNHPVASNAPKIKRRSDSLSVLLIIGVWAYAGAPKAGDKIGRYGFWNYVILLFALYIGDRFSSPPETVKQVARAAIVASCGFLLWAWRFDSHRTANLGGASS